ncbi:MAG: hypothetical protein WBB23_23765 [Desulforhopalus sp.]
MVYSYLLDLYKVLDERKNSLELQLSQAANEPELNQFLNGRLAVINDFKEFLTTHYNAKLPRRMQAPKK